MIKCLGCVFTKGRTMNRYVQSAWRMTLFFFLCSFVLSAEEYDCAFIGSSPLSLFEAMYQASLGNRVLLLEQAGECGGAWKSIDVCGIPHADLGCHQIGNNQELGDFLTTYAGCRLVSLDNFLVPYESNRACAGGFYFSGGCFELIDHLSELLSRLSVDVRLNHRVDEVAFDPVLQQVRLVSRGESFIAKKIYVTPNVAVSVNHQPVPLSGAKYYHLYLLIADPSPPSFSYRSGVGKSMRMVNLTHLVGLTNMGRQLIVFQVHGEQECQQGEKYLEELKKARLVDRFAYLLSSDSYIYEQKRSHGMHQLSPKERALVELLDTGHIINLSRHVARWKEVLKPYQEVCRS